MTLEVSCSNPSAYANCFTSCPKQKVLTFSTPRPPFSAVFFEIFVISPECPPFILFDSLQQKECQKIPKGPFFKIFWHYENFKISHFFVISKNFLKDFKRSPFSFVKFCKRTDVKKSQRAPFTVFGIVRFFKGNNFWLKIRFSPAQHAISDFRFLKAGVFSMRLFKSRFHRNPSSNFTRNDTFCERKGLLKIFGTMRLTGDLHQKYFPQFSVFFLKVFR